MTCEYCEGKKPLYSGVTHDFGIKINQPNNLVVFGYNVCGLCSESLKTKIKYCPMCGKALDGTVELKKGEIVRCKDCVYFREKEGSLPTCDIRSKRDFRPHKNGYCDQALRKLKK